MALLMVQYLLGPADAPKGRRVRRYAIPFHIDINVTAFSSVTCTLLYADSKSTFDMSMRFEG